jgi:hypothetical protein
MVRSAKRVSNHEAVAACLSIAGALQAWAPLVMALIAAAVRHAITLPPREARLLLATFKRMLPNDLSKL